MDCEGFGGEKTGIVFTPGNTFEVLEEVHQYTSYVAVLTSSGWVNVWCARNREGREVGINFCRLERRHK